MAFLSWFNDDISVEIITAEKVGLLSAINNAGITFSDVTSQNELSLQGKIRRSDYKRLHSLLQKRCEVMTVKEKQGWFWSIITLKRRPIFLLGVFILLALSIFLPTRVLFIQVDGNHIVPDNRIIEEVGKAGISIGTPRRGIRSEKIKNRLLSSIPELQWAGINTYGCVATISVEEHLPQDTEKNTTAISSIVARCDGIIESITVTRGNPLCSIGQAVHKDQVLVSAYTDCGSVVKATQAEAEILAQTYHELSAFSLKNTANRQEETGRRTDYSLRIGKKLIKLYKDSGISDASCAKISKEYPLKLPGGFCVPITLIKEQRVYTNMSDISLYNADDLMHQHTQMDRYLLSQLYAGEIIQKKYDDIAFDDVSFVSGAYICKEMIGASRNEETEIHG